MEIGSHENTTYQNTGDIAIAVLRENLNAYILKDKNRNQNS